MGNRYSSDEDVQIYKHDLRALLFWAAVGLSKSQGGRYQDAAETDGDPGIVNSWAEYLKFRLPARPRFISPIQ